MSHVVKFTTLRREKQSAYNALHNITPTTIIRKAELLKFASEEAHISDAEQLVDVVSIRRSIKEWEAAMKKAAKEYRFEDAATARDTIRRLQQLEMGCTESIPI